MEQQDLMDALVQAKRMNNLLNQVMDISKQLAEALDRDDQVSVRMLIAMREEPIHELKIADQALEQQCLGLADTEDRLRLAELLRGGEARAAEESLLERQVTSNRRLLKELIDLDKILNRKLTREQSIYND